MPNKNSSLLTPSEKFDIYGIPRLSDAERKEYFTLSPKEIKAVKTFKNHENAIHFLICLVFFKIKKTFVSFQYRDITNERRYILARYFPNAPSPKSLPKSQTTITRIENIVLHLCGYQRLTLANHKKIKTELQKLASSKPRQRELLKSLLDLLVKNRYAIPAITTMQELVSEVWNKEHDRIIKDYKRNTNKQQRQLVLSLLNKADTLHCIMDIRQDMKGFRTQELNQELEKHNKIQPIFFISQTVLPKLQLPLTTVEYYASLIHYYSGARLKQLNPFFAQIYLICYCFKRYQMLNDNLLESLKKRTLDYKNAANNYAKDQALKQLDVVKEIRQKVSSMLMAIKQQPGHQVSKRMLYKYLPASDWITAAMLLADDKFDKDILFWQYVDSMEDSIKLSLRPLLMAIDCVVSNNPLLHKVIEYTKNTIAKGVFHKKPLPSPLKSWVPKRYREHILFDGKIIHNRFEFLLYMQMVHHMSTDKISLKHSIKFKSVDDYCLQRPKWKKEKSNILKRLDHPKLMAPIRHTINRKRKSLDQLFKELNESIKNGNNNAIKIIHHQDGSKSWRLRANEPDFEESEAFFSNFIQRSIVDILHFVNEKINFTKAFSSILPKSQKRDKDISLIMAVILANAIRIGPRKMAAISDLNESSLLSTEAAFVRIESVINAINIINNAAAKLPIYKKWYINSVLHGSIDGIKLEASRRNFKTRYSSKYFGQGVGVAALNEVVNSFSIASKLIGANEYEGHFAFEMVHHQNASSISPSRLSSDKHGTNALNHALFDLTSYMFAPRYPRPHREILWGFGNSKNYKDFIIKPTKFVAEDFMKDEWDNIQRLIASLLTGEANPTHLIRKLSTQNYNNNTKKALAQYNQVVKTEYLLNYLLYPDLRRAVRHALNRGEGYNRLYRAITILNKGDLRGQSEIEMELWNQCTRLVTSVILYYNTHILNNLYQQARNHDEKEYLAAISPSSWCHINLMGYYQFMGKDSQKTLERWIKNWDWKKSTTFVENETN